MRGDSRRKGSTSIRVRIREIIVHLAVPLCLLAFFLLLMLFGYGIRYAGVSSNISTASRFNRNFKDEVDLKMYYFVTGSSTELPLPEVDEAEELAQTLLGRTRNRESMRAVSGALNLCGNLRNCIFAIQETEGYDNRIHQLETNVYVITELIQKYMYTYLYHEAGELATLKARLNRFLAVGLSLSLAVMILVIVLSLRRSLRLADSITRPIDELDRRVEEIGQGDLSARAPVDAEDEQLRALGAGLERMVIQLNEQRELTQREHDRLRSMELALVQAQINPHFLYNTLDAITWLIETEKSDQAVEMVSSLSTYFRSFLSNGKDIITLREEALHVRSYLEIQQVRYKDILQYEIGMDPSLDGVLVPKMTLQPLVENAIYHGIKPKRGGGTVRISSSREDGRAILQIQDDGCGMSGEALDKLRLSLEKDEGKGFGMLASYKRLRLMYGSDLDFEIESAPNGGTCITIRFPFRKEE